MFELDTTDRIKILSEYLEEDIEDFEVCDYDAQLIEFYNSEWLVLTDIEADNRAYDYMREGLYTFNDWFLLGYVKDHNLELSHIKHILNMCDGEAVNATLEALIGDLDDLKMMFDDAMSNDGRGHYLAHYDHDEIEVETRTTDDDNKREYVYIYRVN